MTIRWETATADEILAHLHEMDLAAFEHAVKNDQFNDEHVRVLLKDPHLSSDLVERISREARFFKSNAIRVALALHPELPRVRGLELLRHLFWRDLLRVASSPRVHPQLRTTADQFVSDRIPDLTIGERVAIARTCGRGVLRALRNDPVPRVIEALMMNFRFTEEDAIYMASTPDSRPETLAVLARQPKWRQRPAVRLALVRNRKLTLPLALGLLPEMGPGDLQVVARQRDLRRLLRQGAQRLLDERRTSLRGGR